MLGRFYWAVFGALALVLLSAPAHASWYEAQSDHFVIYADTRGEDLRDFAEMLERYHAAMVLETGRQVERPSPSNRLTVYMVGSYDNLRDLYSGNRNSRVGGFYIPKAEGSVAFVPNIRISGGDTDFALTVLLHEYAHHFLIGTARHAMPRWLSEGAAEYFASARFNRDGSVDIGLPNNDRAYEISQAAEVSLAELFDYDLYRERRKGSSRYTAYYGRSWLLFHYLAFSETRRGQLQTYWRAVTSGMDSTEAAEQVFGDLERLEKEVSTYGRQRKMKGIRYNEDQIKIGAIGLRELSDGHAAAMPVIIRSKRGVRDNDIEQHLNEAREIAAEHSADSWAQAALAEAEFDAGNDTLAVSAADRALLIDSSQKTALVQKGKALFRMAQEAEDRDSAVQLAMRPFEQLNALESDNTQPLIYFYRSFVDRGVPPPDGARHALERASQLAPFDHSLALQTAFSLASEGKLDLARFVLRPVAANPHGGKLVANAEAFLIALKGRPDGERVNARIVIRDDEASEADED